MANKNSIVIDSMRGRNRSRRMPTFRSLGEALEAPLDMFAKTASTTVSLTAPFGKQEMKFLQLPEWDSTNPNSNQLSAIGDIVDTDYERPGQPACDYIAKAVSARLTLGGVGYTTPGVAVPPPDVANSLSPEVGPCVNNGGIPATGGTGPDACPAFPTAYNATYDHNQWLWRFAQLFAQVHRLQVRICDYIVIDENLCDVSYIGCNTLFVGAGATKVDPMADIERLNNRLTSENINSDLIFLPQNTVCDGCVGPQLTDAVWGSNRSSGTGIIEFPTPVLLTPSMIFQVVLVLDGAPNKVQEYLDLVEEGAGMLHKPHANYSGVVCGGAQRNDQFSFVGGMLDIELAVYGAKGVPEVWASLYDRMIKANLINDKIQSRLSGHRPELAYNR